MTLPREYQDVVDEARVAYIEAVSRPGNQDAQKQFERLLRQVSILLDLTQDQAFEVVVMP